MEEFILAENPAKRTLLIGLAELRSREEAHVVGHAVIVHVVSDTAFEKLQAFLDPLVAILVVVKFHRHIERKVVSLVLPNLDEVGLNFRQRLQRCCELVVVFIFLVLKGLHPQDVHCHTTQTHRSQFHRFTGWVDLRNTGLGQFVRTAHFRKPATFVFQLAFCVSYFRTRDHRQWNQQAADNCDVNNLSNEGTGTVLFHFAISRVLSEK